MKKKITTIEIAAKEIFDAFENESSFPIKHDKVHVNGRWLNYVLLGNELHLYGLWWNCHEGLFYVTNPLF